jgi:hypothetical protein
MVTFPDPSAQEEMIRQIGNAELLRKRGKKILRFKKTTYGTEDDLARYNKIKELVHGRVLSIGLGMGHAAEMILARSEVTELISYEIESDIANVYSQEHGTEPKHNLEVKDAIANKPTGTFDVVLYELEFCTQALFNQAKQYLTWAWQRLNVGGSVIVPFSDYSAAAVKELAPPMSETTFIAEATGRIPRMLFIRVEKTG